MSHTEPHTTTPIEDRKTPDVDPMAAMVGEYQSKMDGRQNAVLTALVRRVTQLERASAQDRSVRVALVACVVVIVLQACALAIILARGFASPPTTHTASVSSTEARREDADDVPLVCPECPACPACPTCPTPPPCPACVGFATSLSHARSVR
jgi:hypothetical protein